ncbi:hypothetical protein E1263_31345 [Kribbella antibiotica]|uniref:Uncharacterized protein n=1 Tax=Kribbella antibiotica TaxID=190195 RepID=A0A4R4YZH3_9ACTN|nr:hypothetical protein [Kribbella antibiotica]TDD50064.1 hypothetical protein E1263_31345 [Kribbella antibiotica]
MRSVRPRSPSPAAGASAQRPGTGIAVREAAVPLYAYSDALHALVLGLVLGATVAFSIHTTIAEARRYRY